MSSERDISNQIRLALGAGPSRVFRNNVGEAWLGPWHHAADGSVIITAPRRVIYGVCNPGGSDLVGWTTVDGVAVFTAIEVKNGRRQPTPEQSNFIARVAEAGGIAGVARSVDEAREIVAAWGRRT